MDNMQWAHATHPSSPNHKAMLAADAYIGRQLSVCLDHKLPRVQNFLKVQRISPGSSTSARMMLAAICTFQQPKTQSDLDKIKKRYRTGVFFTHGMDEDEAQLGVHKCIEAFEADPHRSTHPFATQLALLAKLVPAPGACDNVTAAFSDPHAALNTLVVNYRAKILVCELDPGEDARSLELARMKSVLSYAVAAGPASAKPPRHHTPWSKRPPHLSAFDASTCTDSSCEDHADTDGFSNCNTCDDQHDLEAHVATGACWDCGKQVPEAHPMRQCNSKCD